MILSVRRRQYFTILFVIESLSGCLQRGTVSLVRKLIYITHS